MHVKFINLKFVVNSWHIYTNKQRLHKFYYLCDAWVGQEEKFIFVPFKWHYRRHCSRLDSATWLAFLIFHSSRRSQARGAPDILRANPTVFRLRRNAFSKIWGKIVQGCEYTQFHSSGRYTARHIIYSTIRRSI